MKLFDKIVDYLKKAGKPVHVRALYGRFQSYEKHSIRARLSEGAAEGEGQVRRIGKGLYVAMDGDAVGISATGDCKAILRELKADGVKFDFVFLDPPFRGRGQRGGNREIARFPTMEAEEFGEVVDLVADLLSGPEAPVFVIFTKGSETTRAREKFLAEVEARLTKCEEESEYVKLSKSGKRHKIGRYELPPEGIFVYSQSGRAQVEGLPPRLEFERPVGYPTEKPAGLLRRLVAAGSKVGSFCLDPFAGSGVFLRACLDLGRSAFAIDVATTPADYLLNNPKTMFANG